MASESTYEAELTQISELLEEFLESPVSIGLLEVRPLLEQTLCDFREMRDVLDRVVDLTASVDDLNPEQCSAILKQVLEIILTASYHWS
jgi:hypothetical protein